MRPWQAFGQNFSKKRAECGAAPTYRFKGWITPGLAWPFRGIRRIIRVLAVELVPQALVDHLGVGLPL